MKPTGTTDFVTFQVAGQLLGIPVREVREVLPAQIVAKVPLANNAVAGLLNLRGQIVTAIDVRKRLGIEDDAQAGAPMNIVVSEGGELFSLVVDSVGDVLEVEQSAFAQTPPTLSSEWKDCCAGVYRLPRGLLVAIDVSALVDLPIQTEQS